MDGNGRWAERRGRPRAFGHIKGARMAKRAIEFASQRGVRFLTLYAFSTENWLRPSAEVQFLMRLMGRHLRRERASLVENNIRFQAIGDISRLPEPMRNEVLLTEEATKDCTGLRLISALSYGSRQEMTRAVREISSLVQQGLLDPSRIDESLVQSHLETAEIPDPDLVIRTSGECRLSNFLLWQAAYSEIYITETCWPDFDEASFELALKTFASRSRRFGMTQQQTLQTSRLN
jgi:undecaprenyl diphosphate synthase